ncbi:MAG: cyanophycin synthetase [Lautropia sp.]
MKHKDIQILSVTHLKGPNMWTYRPVLEALVDIGKLEDYPSDKLPGFVDRLCEWLPSLVEHRCSYGERGGFVRRLQEGTWPAHIMEHVTLELQNLAGLPGGFGKAREIPTRGVYKVIVRAWQEDVTRAALTAGRDLVMAAINDTAFDVARSIKSLRELTDDLLLGPSTACIVDAADDRDIPCMRLNTGNLVQLGYGARLRRIWTAETDRTSAIAEGISRDKDLTKQLLQSCGVPVPEGRLVHSIEDAWDAAEDIGLPVVVKPYDGNHGRGVFTNVTSREELEKAYAVAEDEGSGVMVERFVRGNEHRLLVVGGRMVAAARGEPASVIGDGRSTILELIERQLNSDPRRGSGEDCPLNFIRIDSAARLELSRQGFDGSSVPPPDTPVLIQRSGNVAFDVTDLVHPDVAEDVALAARVVGLDIAGVDLVAEDISRPLAGQRGAIVEVNAGPGLLMHLKPANGGARPVGRAIVDHLFAGQDNGRIPVIGITGTRDTTPVAQVIAHMLRLAGKRVGLGCSTGMYLGRRHIERTDGGNWITGRRLLQNCLVDAAVLENSPAVIANEGLAYDRCQVGIVTHIDPDSTLPANYLDTSDQMYRLLRTQVDVVLKGGAAVLNAHDPLTVEMADLCDGEVIYFARDPALPVIAAHRAAGGRAILFDEGEILIASGASQDSIVRLEAAPALAGNTRQLWRGDIAIDCLLAAVGAACALNLRSDLIATAINTFVPDYGSPAGAMTAMPAGAAPHQVPSSAPASAPAPGRRVRRAPARKPA